MVHIYKVKSYIHQHMKFSFFCAESIRTITQRQIQVHFVLTPHEVIHFILIVVFSRSSDPSYHSLTSQMRSP